jgi:23S rRNA (cytidine1920-2'-O)/16S rRNA (cytidine1409-2'-O)-methyltransferase
VRDPAVHEAVLREVVAGLDVQGLGATALAVSPLRGADGNVEFFVRARRGGATLDADVIARVVAGVEGAAV